MRQLRPTRSVRTAGPLAALLALALALSACSRDPNAGLTVREIKERYARQLLEGVAHGMNVVTAERVDPKTLELYDLRLFDGVHLLHADRAEILVSSELGAVSLRLHGVVTADPESGQLVAIEGFTTEPAKIASLSP